MLEYLKFSIGGFFKGYTKVHMTVAHGVATVSVESTPYPQANGITTLSREDSQSWLSILAALRIGGWKARYTPVLQILDGETWELEYKEQNKRCRHIAGDNDYPENWSRFLQLMDLVAPMFPPKQIETLAVEYDNMDLIPIDSDMDLGLGSLLRTTEEKLALDRQEESLTLSHKNDLGLEIQKIYHVTGSVPALMDRCEDCFRDLAATHGVLEADTPSYTLQIQYHDGTILKKSGMFNQRGLPTGWAGFANEIREFLDYYGLVHEILDPGVYGIGGKPGKYRFCSVTFAEDGKTYYYRTDDKTLQVGDKVIVPTGTANTEVKAKIVGIEYFDEGELPMPLEEVKPIIRKAGK